MIGHNKDIRDTNSIYEIVDCITTGVYGDAPMQLVECYSALPADSFHDYLRVLAVPYLFHAFEGYRKSSQNPVPQFIRDLDTLRAQIEHMVSDGTLKNLLKACYEGVNDSMDTEVKQHTGQHYGTLFKAFDDKSFFAEARDLLATRLERNEIRIDNLASCSVLDQGCGGGRYSVAWSLLGAKRVVGLDYSQIGIEDAQRRCQSAGISNVEFHLGSVLEMPFEDGSFDVVYSNGVLHHTEDWEKGISEQLRVMKKGGWGWQYLIEAPGGIFWDKIEILRAILKNVSKPYAQKVMHALNIPTNRIFYMLDHVMVPINTRVTEDELLAALEKHGAIQIRRLTRGTDFDRVEAIYQNEPYAIEKFGVGEHRYVFIKG